MKKFIMFALFSGLYFGICGFNLDNAIVPENEIVSGGPPKDGIPAILEPEFIQAQTIGYMASNEQVIAVELGGETKAYPINILIWHEIVNDTVGGVPVAVTF